LRRAMRRGERTALQRLLLLSHGWRARGGRWQLVGQLARASAVRWGSL
jgi:hypothetical protein